MNNPVEVSFLNIYFLCFCLYLNLNIKNLLKVTNCDLFSTPILSTLIYYD